MSKTNCIVLGGNNEKTGKPIECVAILNESSKIVKNEIQASAYKNIERIAKNYSTLDHKQVDLMYAYDDDRNQGCLYLGHWNDGFVKEN